MPLYKTHAEAIARAFGIFSAATISTLWAKKSAPSYDTWLMGVAALAGIVIGTLARKQTIN